VTISREMISSGVWLRSRWGLPLGLTGLTLARQEERCSYTHTHTMRLHFESWFTEQHWDNYYTRILTNWVHFNTIIRFLIAYGLIQCRNLQSNLSDAWIIVSLIIYVTNLEFRGALIWARVHLSGSGGQKISGPLFAAKFTSLIFPDWPSLKIRRFL
jgi:hypothetical protein